MSKMAYIISQERSFQSVQSRHPKHHCKLDSVSFKIRLPLCFNYSRAILRDFLKMTHESRFAGPSEILKNDIWCFTHILADFSCLKQIFLMII